ncbi:MAG: GNAT family N-acetyltransferase [Candidatus Scalindua sp.]|nr:GNAT family N-acetyltransferase [Candidatus Scalindua sp.]MCR4345525.1 GNAT family N-acetyltransferase [Candidatus Scalindua sp.]
MKYEIKKLEEREVKDTLTLFRSIVDELHADSSKAERSHYKATHPANKVKNQLHDKDSVYLIGKLGDEIISFMFALVVDGVGNIHWSGVKAEHRKKGYAKLLLEKTINIFIKKSCHEARVFIYPEAEGAHKLFKSFAFEEKSYIDEQFFGVSIILMEKPLAPVPLKKIAKKVILTGEAGQGIKLMAHTLGNILAKMGKEVSLNIIYGAAVRGGEITAELIYSDEKIETPFFEKADLGVCLSKSRKGMINAKELIVEATAYDSDLIHPIPDVMPFAQIAMDQFHSHVFVNMIALGRLLSIIGIKIEKVDFESEFQSRFLEENTRAVKFGYTYQD